MGLVEKTKSKRTGKYISLCWFRAYDKEMSEFFLHEEKPNVCQVELLLLDICHTITINEIKIMEFTNE